MNNLSFIIVYIIVLLHFIIGYLVVYFAPFIYRGTEEPEEGTREENERLLRNCSDLEYNTSDYIPLFYKSQNTLLNSFSLIILGRLF